MTAARIGAGACFAAGVVDLIAINLWLVPRDVAPPPDRAAVIVASSVPATAAPAAVAGIDRPDAGSAAPASPRAAPTASVAPEPSVSATAIAAASAAPTASAAATASAAPSASAAAQPAAPVVSAEPLGEPLVIYFAYDSATVPADGLEALIALARRVNTSNEDVRVSIDAYADRSGEKTYNQGLAEARGRAVLAALIRLGVSDKLITTRGHATSGVGAAVGSAELARDRRAEVRLSRGTR